MTALRSTCILIILGCLVTLGCGKRQIQIDRDTRRMIDTMASRELNTIRPFMDSICQLKMDSLVSTMTDSVLLERRKEMRKLLGR